MADDLETLVKGYSDDHLLEQCYRKRSEYSEVAIGVMEKEISRRMISAEKVSEYRDGKKAVSGDTATEVKRAKEDFVAFEDLFTPTDLLLVNAMFDEAKIAFFVDNPPSTVFPTESLSASFLRIHVFKDNVTDAHTLLDAHFIKEEGRYKVRFSNDKERLKALNFHEVHETHELGEAEVGVVLAPAENAAIAVLARRLAGEVDKIEKEQERIVFYYDALEELIEKLEAKKAAALSKADFLAVTEILQIYCDDPAFPAVLNDTVAAILTFFESPNQDR